MTSQSAKRRPPRPKYEGASWVASGVRRLYLEDVIQIYDIMVQYAPQSPTYLRDVEFQNQRSTWYLPPGPSPSAEAAVSDLGAMPVPEVSVEIDDAYVIESRDQLESYNPKNVSKIDMSVKFIDLSFRCDQYAVAVSRRTGDDASTSAYDEIVNIVSRRRERWPAWLGHRYLRNTLLSLALTSAALGLFFSNRWLAVATFVSVALLWLLSMGWNRYWTNRKGVVRLVYSETDSSPWKEGLVSLLVSLAGPIILAALAWVVSQVMPIIRK